MIRPFDSCDCGRPVHARGLCNTCYSRAWRAGLFALRVPLWQRVVDHVEVAGPLTAAAVAVRVGRSEPQVRRALSRARTAGLVERTFSENVRGYGFRQANWRTTI